MLKKFQGDAARGKRGDQRQHFLDSGGKGLDFGQLRPDVHLDSAPAQVFQRGGAGINFLHLFQRDAEFIFVGAGGDLGVGMGVHVGIDPHGDRGDLQARGSPPAAVTRRNSPALTMSNPLPKLARVRRTARLELAFIAKQMR